MSLKLGFIGVGAMGRSHVDLFHNKSDGRAAAVAICSRNPDNISQAKAFAPDVRVFDNESELIASDLDAVVVSSPNSTHVRLASEVIAAGKHLYLEKSCGITQTECDELERIAAGTDRVILIGHELRYSAFFRKIKDLIDAGEIGRPRMTWTKEFRGPFRPKSGNWIENRKLSGGLMVDKNCHHFDLMNWWTAGRPKEVAAFGSLAANRVIEGEDQVNDHATVSVRYDNGALGTLQVCMFARDFPHEDLEMGVVGEGGVLQTRISTVEILQWKRGCDEGEPIVHKVEAKAGTGWGGHLGFAEIHEAFLDAVLKGAAHLTSVGDCVAGTRVAIAAEESAASGAVIRL
ncbi:MAG: Gfo/Idh/MocA family oxidoreductase [Verrucomicrobiae bacterium]|jgi:predicted dehydrogenase|nr:Gfo/Idh/MocA family oxidoreductase [Verrucomicrobiae bacterium]